MASRCKTFAAAVNPPDPTLIEVQSGGLEHIHFPMKNKMLLLLLLLLELPILLIQNTTNTTTVASINAASIVTSVYNATDTTMATITAISSAVSVRQHRVQQTGCMNNEPEPSRGVPC